MNEAQIPSSITVSPDDPASMAQAIKLIGEHFSGRIAALEREVVYLRVADHTMVLLEDNPAFRAACKRVSYAARLGIVQKFIRDHMEAGGDPGEASLHEGAAKLVLATVNGRCVDEQPPAETFGGMNEGAARAEEDDSDV